MSSKSPFNVIILKLKERNQSYARNEFLALIRICDLWVSINVHVRCLPHHTHALFLISKCYMVFILQFIDVINWWLQFPFLKHYFFRFLLVWKRFIIIAFSCCKVNCHYLSHYFIQLKYVRSWVRCFKVFSF